MVEKIKKIAVSLMVMGMLFFPAISWAYDLTLTRVGSQSTLGVDYSLIRYDGSIPALEGTASPSAQVAIKTNTLLGYTTATSSGTWRYVPTALDAGDNSIVITSANQTISFVLRFNSASPSSAVSITPNVLPDETNLPDAGVWEYYILAIIVGLAIFSSGRFLKTGMNKWEGKKNKQ